ncbi:Xanthine_dehydrogenase accessory factor [Hexamita inflata]|uniref:Xanthine dehydrogenase accessory factor n=1 Tax=Hexamita inflata TaxID=28002 RepID=A0AA86NYK6_9EUKA|nr:Xanthine dehydrogenase accessory factor [Hexamita inflata]
MFTPEYLAISKALEYLEEHQSEQIYLCTPISVVGSYPTPVHSKMSVFNKEQAGTVGGGNIEFKIRQFIEDNTEQLVQNYLFTYSMTAEKVECEGMVCGGEVTVLIQRVNYQTLLALKEKLLETGWTEIYEWTQTDPVDEAIQNLAKKSYIDILQLKNFVHSYKYQTLQAPLVQDINKITRQIMGSPTVHIFGGGHVGQCVAQIAKIAGFVVNVYEDRDYFLQPLPQINTIRCALEVQSELDKIMEEISKKENQFIVTVTRGHKCDLGVMRAVFKYKMPKYCGMIGSNTKTQKIWDKLKTESIPNFEELTAQVKAPIGLSIGGDQPGQIGVAIVAQMIQILTGGNKRYM